MPTQRIPPDQWEDYLAGFSAHNQTRLITVDVESQDLGPQRIIDHTPFLGLEPDLKEREPTIIVVAGDPEGGRPDAVTHEIMKPRSIWIKEDEEGRAEALDIETEDGRTIIEFD